VREERFEQGDFAVDLLLPLSPEALIDEAAFDADERLPYWADGWPSARALARHLLKQPPPGRTLELGCGAAALPSLALRARGVDALASDYEADALRFARNNAGRNGLGPLRTTVIDWRRPPPDLAPFALVVAADVLYERRNVDSLAAALPRLVAPGGSFLLADPGRTPLPEFAARMAGSGWNPAERAVREEQAAPGAPPVRVQITEWRRAGRSARPAEGVHEVDQR
jgi:predicted nicotinamide N-methyase